jgi:hypothetical protein
MLDLIKKNTLGICLGSIISAFILWVSSCLYTKVSFIQNSVNSNISQLGLFSIMPVTFFISFSILIFGFFVGLKYLKNNLLTIFVSQTIILIFILNFTPVLLEGTPRFTTSYVNYQAVDYISQKGFIDSGIFWIHNWPSFSVVMSVFSQISQIPAQFMLLIYPTFFNFLLMIGLYVFFRTILDDNKLIWLSMWFVFLGNWIGQDYFSMQSLGFVFIIFILTILLKLLIEKSPTRQQVGILLLFFFYVFSSHLLSSLAILCIFFIFYLSKILPRFALFSILVMFVSSWLVFDNELFLTSNLSHTMEQTLNFNFIFQTNLSNRVVGNFGHIITNDLRIFYTGIIVLFGLAGILFSIKNKKRSTNDKYMLSILLGFCLLIFAFAYGGELFMRLFMFSLIPLAFFASKMILKHRAVFLFAFLFFIIVAPSMIIITNYGNEAIDYVPPSEMRGIDFLYRVSSSGQIIGGSVHSGDFRDLHYHENYSMTSLVDLYSANQLNMVLSEPQETNQDRFVCISYETKMYFPNYLGVNDQIQNLEENLTHSLLYDQIYSNPSFSIYHSNK